MEVLQRLPKHFQIPTYPSSVLLTKSFANGHFFKLVVDTVPFLPLDRFSSGSQRKKRENYFIYTHKASFFQQRIFAVLSKGERLITQIMRPEGKLYNMTCETA